MSPDLMFLLALIAGSIASAVLAHKVAEDALAGVLLTILLSVPVPYVVVYICRGTLAFAYFPFTIIVAVVGSSVLSLLPGLGIRVLVRRAAPPKA